MDPTEFLEHKDITEFISLAGQYCTFVENTNNFEKVAYIQKSLSLLSSLYFYALKLPDPGDTTFETPEKFVSEMEWNEIYNKVKLKLGYHDDYLDVFDPVSKEEGDVSIVSLADNFADIYQDLKNFIVAYGLENEDLMVSSLWDLLYNFQEYWGIKLLNALRVLHRLYYSEEQLDEKKLDSGENGQNVNRNWLFEERRRQSNEEDDEV
ncbi:MAG: DUF5063 domain-containing protein [Bacteroidales bacterium]